MGVEPEMLCLAYVITGSNWCHSLSITHPHPMAPPVGQVAVPGLRSTAGQGPTPLQMRACSANFSILWVVTAIVATARGLTEIHLHARSGSTRIFLVHGWTSWKLYVIWTHMTYSIMRHENSSCRRLRWLSLTHSVHVGTFHRYIRMHIQIEGSR